MFFSVSRTQKNMCCHVLLEFKKFSWKSMYNAFLRHDMQIPPFC